MGVLLGVRAHMDVVVDLVQEEFSCESGVGGRPLGKRGAVSKK